MYWLNVIRLEDSGNWTRPENNEHAARGGINRRTQAADKVKLCIFDKYSRDHKAFTSVFRLYQGCIITRSRVRIFNEYLTR